MIENFQEWAKGAVGKSEKEVTDAIDEAGGQTRVVERNGRAVHGGSSSSVGLAARASLVVVDGIVTEITFG